MYSRMTSIGGPAFDALLARAMKNLLPCQLSESDNKECCVCCLPFGTSDNEDEPSEWITRMQCCQQVIGTDCIAKHLIMIDLAYRKIDGELEDDVRQHIELGLRCPFCRHQLWTVDELQAAKWEDVDTEFAASWEEHRTTEVEESGRRLWRKLALFNTHVRDLVQSILSEHDYAYVHNAQEHILDLFQDDIFRHCERTMTLEALRGRVVKSAIARITTASKYLNKSQRGISARPFEMVWLKQEVELLEGYAGRACLALLQDDEEERAAAAQQKLRVLNEQRENALAEAWEGLRALDARINRVLALHEGGSELDG